MENQKICSFCGQGKVLFSSRGNLVTVGGANYCRECWKKSFGHLENHPIPDDMVDKKLYGWIIKFTEKDEFKIIHPTFDYTVRIHVLMMHTRKISSKYMLENFFLGIDRHSGKLVYVYYDDDGEGLYSVSIQFLTKEKFIKVIRKYPFPVRAVFADLTSENTEKFLNVYIPMDFSEESFFFSLNYGSYVKVMYISVYYGWRYALVPKEPYLAWENGKSVLNCIYNFSDLQPVAIKYVNRARFGYGSGRLTFPRKARNAIFHSIYACVEKGIPVTNENANIIHLKNRSSEIENLYLPHRMVNGFFEFMEQLLKINETPNTPP